MPNMTRLRRLLHVLETLPPEADFNLTHFAAFSYSNAKPEPHRLEHAHVCGTNACAIGYGALDPVLREEGLTLYAYPLRAAVDINDFNALAHDPTVQSFRINFEDSAGYYASLRFFELDGSQFNDLFTPGGYTNEEEDEPVTREQVIERLREFVA